MHTTTIISIAFVFFISTAFFKVIFFTTYFVTLSLLLNKERGSRETSGVRYMWILAATLFFSSLTTSDFQLTTYDFRLTTYDFRLTTYDFRLTTFDSRLTAHRSRLTAHRSQLTTHRSPLLL